MPQRLFSKTIIYNVSLNTCFITFFHGNTHYGKKMFELMNLSLAQAEVASENKRCLFFSCQIYELVRDNDVHQESQIGGNT
jgi:hypothetical protein